MIDREGRFLVARHDATSLYLLPAMANRHGLITGATGTGKTVSLQVLAESFAALGVPVFGTDVKGDLAGLARPGGGHPKIEGRVEQLALSDDGFAWGAVPVRLWDVFGKTGHPLRATPSAMGPLLMARALGLNDTQTGVLQILFRIADDDGLLLLDLKDLRKLAEYVADHRSDFAATHGHIAPASLGAVQRGLLTLEEQGGDAFFGEPSLDLFDLLARERGQGVVHLLAADRLMSAPRLYGAFLLWLLSELYESLPEVGDLPLPKLVLFFDEAHLLFADAPRALLEKIEQVVRLVRSKGVGVFFVTQSPADIPPTVLAQLGNRIQHALRAYTPGEKKAVRAAADAFRPNPALDTATAIGDLATGEALVSFLDAKGAPAMVERAWILPPQSRVGALTEAERGETLRTSPLYGRYEHAVDRESAYEMLSRRITERQAADEEARAATEAEKAARRGGRNAPGGLLGDFARKTSQSVTRNIANQIGRAITRGLLGGLFGGKR